MRSGIGIETRWQSLAVMSHESEEICDSRSCSHRINLDPVCKLISSVPDGMKNSRVHIDSRRQTDRNMRRRECGWGETKTWGRKKLHTNEVQRQLLSIVGFAKYKPLISWLTSLIIILARHASNRNQSRATQPIVTPCERGASAATNRSDSHPAITANREELRPPC